MPGITESLFFYHEQSDRKKAKPFQIDIKRLSGYLQLFSGPFDNVLIHRYKCDLIFRFLDMVFPRDITII